MNPLGHHIISWDAAAKDTVHRAPGACLKLVGCDAVDREMVQWYKREHPDGLIIYRPFFEYEDLSDPRGWARRALAEAAPIASWVDFYEGENERYQTRKHDAFRRYADWSVEYGDELHRHGERYACLSSSVLNPDLAILPDYYDAFRIADAIALHCYWWTRLAGSRGAFYYREMLAALPPDCRKRVILTECGPDSGQRQGWKTAYAEEQNPSEAFAADLLQYAEELAQDGVVAALFSLGTRTDFADFDYGGVATVAAVMNTPLFIESPDPLNNDDPSEGDLNMAYAVGPGILAKMQEQADEPASHEWYPQPEWALAWGKSGNLYCYLKETNLTSVFHPFA